MSALAQHPLPRVATRGLSTPVLTVDLDAVAANVRHFVARTPEVMAVVKADGFGHGAVQIARTALAAGATRLGVATLDEGVALRREGIAAPLLCWLLSVDAEWEQAARHRIEVAIGSSEHLAAVTHAARASGIRMRVHLHLDCGMAREGAPTRIWNRLCEQARAAELSGAIEVVGIMGHLPHADDPDHRSNAEGLARFSAGLRVAHATGLAPSVRHLATTSAAVTNAATHHSMCRIGAGLVGIDPSGTTRLRPAMTLTAPVVAVRDVTAGCGVGYGHTWRAGHATRLATIPLGYADGLPRVASGRGEVLVGGRRAPIVGRISMDQCTVDVGAAPVGLGDTVTVWGGEGPTTAEWARWADTIEHEIVTGVGARVARRVVGEVPS